MNDSRTVVVELRDDGQIEIRSHAAYARDRTVGLCPSGGQIFGVAAESRDDLVATVSAAVASARLMLDNGTTVDCRLRPIEGTDARYLVVELRAGVQVGALTAYDERGAELSRLDHEAERLAMEAHLGPDSPLRQIR